MISDDHSSFKDRLRDYKRTIIIQALDHANGNLSIAARSLALDTSNFRKLAKSLDLL
jgi:transcriptional regulator with GAF, ATPase, and Fis domain